MDYQNQYSGYGQQAPQQPAQASNQGTPLGWDDEVEEKTFILLPEGEYPFRVEGFDREQSNGTDKMPPCNVANVHLIVYYEGEEVKIDKKLYLLSTNGQLFAFFKSLGAPTLPNGRVKMDWANIIGTNGRLLISHRQYSGNTYHQVKKFLEPTGQVYTPQQKQPSWQDGKW